MAALVRLWLVPARAGSATGLEPDDAALLRSAAPLALLCDADSRALAGELRAQLALPDEPALWSASDDEALRTLADRHGGGSLVLVLAAERALAIAQLALAHPPSRAFSLEIRRHCAVDWPPTEDRAGRPALIGLDLDWLPPPPPTQRAKFPGGPGSAPSARG